MSGVGLHGFKASFTDGPFRACGLSLTATYVRGSMPCIRLYLTPVPVGTGGGSGLHIATALLHVDAAYNVAVTQKNSESTDIDKWGGGVLYLF